MTGNGKTITFKYNDAGIRTQKTVNGVTTTYHLVGDKVTYEENATDKIYYTYDNSDNLISMNLSTKNPDGTWTVGVEYYYIRNAQGDIIGLYDVNGTQVVSYSYDSWGKIVSIEGTLKDSVGVKNPYLYRGYRFDTETGLYYLQSRYHNAEWGRFINADSEGGAVGDLLSHNVFSYCGNNPVNRLDQDGRAWMVIGAIAGAVVGGIAGAAYSYYTIGSVDWKYVAGGAAAGALIGAGLGYAAEAVFSAIAATSATATTVASQADKVSQVANKISKTTQSSSNQVVNAIKNSSNIITKTNSSGDLNHFNIELQTKAGNIKYNVHLYVNEAMEVIKRVDTQ